MIQGGRPIFSEVNAVWEQAICRQTSRQWAYLGHLYRTLCPKPPAEIKSPADVLWALPYIYSHRGNGPAYPVISVSTICTEHCETWVVNSPLTMFYFSLFQVNCLAVADLNLHGRFPKETLMFRKCRKHFQLFRLGCFLFRGSLHFFSLLFETFPKSEVSFCGF